MKGLWQRFGKQKYKLFLTLTVSVFVCILLAIGYLIGQHANLSPRPVASNVTKTDKSNSLLTPTVNTSDIDIYQLWALVNEQRTSAGLSALSLNPKLNQSASAKCDDMVTKNYWSHNDPAGNTPWHFFTDAGVQYIHLAENLGEGFHSSQATIDAWMKSDEHKANILDPRFTDVGYAVCKSDHFVQNYGQPALLIVQHFAQV